MSKTMNLRIDDEFKALIPPLADEEYKQLEDNIINEGCRDALVTWNGVIVDGHNRYEICTRHNIPFTTTAKDFDTRDDVILWIIRNQFGRRNLSAYQRGQLALRMKDVVSKRARENMSLGGVKSPLQQGRQNSDDLVKPTRTDDELGKIAGVSRDTIRKIERIEESATPEVKEAVGRGDISIHEAYKRTKKAEKKQARQEQETIALQQLPEKDERFSLHLGDIDEMMSLIEPNSIDVIITDPPYPGQYLSVYSTLASHAARVLKPGGSMVAMCGQYYLPEIMQMFSEHMTYQWMACYLTSGGQSPQIFPRKVNTFWKPLLWYVKGQYDGEWVGDVIKSGGNEKDAHHWQQSISGMNEIVSKFSKVGDTILDPFCGSGTTGIAAIRINRLFVGIDVDEKAIDTAWGRLKSA